MHSDEEIALEISRGVTDTDDTLPTVRFPGDWALTKPMRPRTDHPLFKAQVKEVSWAQKEKSDLLNALVEEMDINE